MNIRELKTWEENNKIYVYISVEQWNLPCVPKFLLETIDVLKLLKEKQIEVGKCINLQKLKTGDHILVKQLGFLKRKRLTNLKNRLY